MNYFKAANRNSSLEKNRITQNLKNYYVHPNKYTGMQATPLNPLPSPNLNKKLNSQANIVIVKRKNRDFARNNKTMWCSSKKGIYHSSFPDNSSRSFPLKPQSKGTLLSLNSHFAD